MGSEDLPGEALILLGPRVVSYFKAVSAMWDYLCILFIWNYLFSCWSVLVQFPPPPTRLNKNLFV